MLAIVRSTNMPIKAIGHCSIQKESGFVKISEKPTQKKYRTSTCCAADFPASLFQFLENGVDSKIREARCSLKLPGWLQKKSLRICCLKMFPDCSAMTGAGRLRPSSIRWTDWGMVWNGRCLTARISMSPSPAAGCTLSDILTSDAGEKYFLSLTQQAHLLYKSSPERKASESTPRKV